MAMLIVGGTGFIARHLCERLHATGMPGATVSFNPDLQFLLRWAPSIRGLQFGSAEARRALAQAEVVVHLAHRSRPSSYTQAPQMEIQSDVVSAANLFREILDVNPHCHLVYASSGGQIYGTGHSEPIPESAAPSPTTPYALGKHLIEQIIAYFARVAGASATVLRIANPVGRWQLYRAQGLVAAAVRAARSGEELTIFGDGCNQRDYFDADELAAFLARFSNATWRKAGTYNIGSGRGMTERDVLEAVARVLGRQVRHRYAPGRAFDLRYAVLDTTRTEEDLGWRPQVPIEETILKLDRALPCAAVTPKLVASSATSPKF